jgi:hypothetical protein
MSDKEQAKADMRAILRRAQANHQTLLRCTGHRFFDTPPKHTSADLLGKRFTCLKCGGAMNFGSVGHYIAGFRHAGGNVDAVWPGWDQK